MQHSSLWTNIIDGTAIGPSGVVSLPDGEATMTALWDDERGVQIEIDLPPMVVTSGELRALRDLCDQLLATPAPRVHDCTKCVVACTLIRVDN